MNGHKRVLSRRQAMKGVAALGAGAALAGSERLTLAQTEITDEMIFAFALNLEYLETEYYLRGLTGQGIGPEDIGDDPGQVTGGTQVPFTNEAFRQFADELADNELAHVRYYREQLGNQAVDRPAIDLAGGFAAVGQAAGLGENFDPFADEISFFLGGMLFEDVGVTGYKRASALIQDKKHLEDIAGILAVEAYHMGMARSVIYQAGQQAIDAANAVTAARGTLNGKPEIEQGVEVDGEANFVPSDEWGIAFSRTPEEVLQIVYITPETGVSSGGFFPNGFNGDITTT